MCGSIPSHFHSETKQNILTVAEAAGQRTKALSLFPIKSLSQKGYRSLVFGYTNIITQEKVKVKAVYKNIVKSSNFFPQKT